MQHSIKPFQSLNLFISRERLHYLLIVCSAIYASYMLAVFPHWTVDDAYISYRYAYNLVNHGELNWNIGQDPVEGYTGIMLPLMVTPAIAFHVDPAVASKAISLVSFIASALLLWLISAKMNVVPVVRSVLVALFLVTPSFYTHVTSGLETMLFTALILASFYALLRKSDTALAILLLLTSLTRPEGVLLAILFIALRLFQVGRKNTYLKTIIRFVVLYLIPGTIYFLWRWNYYGYLLPNTFYVKVNGNNTIAEGIYWFGAYVICPLVATIIILPKISRISPMKLEVGAISIFIISLFTLYSKSMLIMNYGQRFFMPLYPVLLMLLASMVDSSNFKSKRIILSAIPLATQFIVCFTMIMSMEKEWVEEYWDVLTNEHIPTAEYINTHVPSDSWLLLNDTGLMPYLTERKTIDIGALNDEFLAHNSDKEAIKTYFSSFNASAITVPCLNEENGQCIDMPDYNLDLSNYTLITNYKDPKWSSSHQGFRVYLFLRKDLVPNS